MKKGRRYKTERERRNAIQYRGSKLRNMKREMYLKNVERTDTRIVRKTVNFSLIFNKVDKYYILVDLKKNISLDLTKETVQDEELAMVHVDDFNQLAEEILANHK